MKGQIEMFKQRKAPVYHISLTSCYCECPNCKNQNIGHSKYNYYTGNWYQVFEDECPECGQPLTWDDEEIEKVCKKSKDVIECEKFGLQGAVHKNDKGQWEQWVDPYNAKICI